MIDTIIVIPCYNEAERLDLPRMRGFIDIHPKYMLLMIDDGSSDRTLEVLDSLRGAMPEQVVVHRLAENRGKAEAVRQGILQALEFEPRLVAYCDADLATPLETMPQYVDVFDRLPQIQVVVGSRIPLLGHRIQRHPLRQQMGRAFSMVASWVLGVSIYDTQCGAKMFRVTASTRALFAEPFLSRWIFDVEILSRMIVGTGRTGIQCCVYEMPLEAWQEVRGSKLKGSDFARATLQLLDIYRRYFLRRRPCSESSRLPDIQAATPTESADKREAA